MFPLFLAVPFLLVEPVAAQSAPGAPGDLTITEFMAEPVVVPDYYGEWFEIYNASGEALDLDGLQVRDATGGEQFTVSGPLIMDPGEYIVLGVSDTTALNGGITVHYVYDHADFKLTRTGDTITLLFGGAVIDSITWNTAWNVQNKKAHQVSLNAFDLEWANNLSHNWCESRNYQSSSTLYHTAGVGNEWCSGQNSDSDGDGYTPSTGDCDDQNSYVNPFAIDGDSSPCILPDGCGVANDDANCDGVRDDGLTDDDGDGFAEVEGDCDDTDTEMSPAGYEGRRDLDRDEKDNDCNCFVDDVDYDGDGYSAATTGYRDMTPGCQEPEVWDCAPYEGGEVDADPDVNPGAVEIPYDGIDNNCSGSDLCDVDGDGYLADPEIYCPGVGCCPGGDDCDDSNPDVHPNASEGTEPDGIDNDCNGIIDDPFLDMDGDGYTVDEGDCLDDPEHPRAHLTYPGADELCDDDVDNDCNGLVNDGCTNVAPFSTLQGGGCSATGATARSSWAALALSMLALLASLVLPRSRRWR